VAVPLEATPRSEAWRPYFRSIRKLRVDGRLVRYVDAGDGPCVFLLHGIGHSAFGWRQTIAALVRAGYRALAIDTPGFGYSDPMPRQDLRSRARLPELVAAFLDGVLDTFDVDHCVTVGHSLGGAYAAALAARHPARVTRLVLAAPAVGPAVGLGVHLLGMRAARLAFLPTKQFIRWSLRVTTHDPRRIDEEEIDELARTLCNPVAAKSFMDVVGAGLTARGLRSELRLLDELREIQVPTLVLWGRHDQVVPVSNSAVVMDLLPDAELRLFEDSGHMLILEEAARFNRLLLDFLRR
jgi:pimeloyl-ACP methyl ester carboxylesterase